MTYSPATFDTAEYFFRQNGFITSSMVHLIGAAHSWPTPDDSYGTATVKTNSVIKGGGGANWWNGWDLSGGPFNKILATTYWHDSAVDAYDGIYVSTLTTSEISGDMEYYYSAGFNSVQKSGIRKASGTAGNGSSVATDATIYQFYSANAPIFGLGIYVEHDIQKMFVQSGDGSWLEIISATDSDHETFQSVYIRGYGAKPRAITPFNVWGEA